MLLFKALLHWVKRLVCSGLTKLGRSGIRGWGALGDEGSVQWSDEVGSQWYTKFAL